MPPLPPEGLVAELLSKAPDLSSLVSPVYCLKPHLPVGGRLTEFLPFWTLVSCDQWVTSVVAHGYRLPFSGTKPEGRVTETRPPPGGLLVLRDEVSELCAKCAVEPVPLGQRDNGYYSTYFLVDKKDGGQRPILNLKRFNRYLVIQTFKMETLRSIISIAVPGVWMASIDFKDAYLHVPMARMSWKYLRFALAGKCYQYRVTPFGLATAPRLFTQVVRVLIVWLRLSGVRLHAYLDDVILFGDSPEQVYYVLRLAIAAFTHAGFLINVKKSDLVPTQDLVYIGGRFRTDLGLVFLPEDRKVAMIRVIKSFARVGSMHPARAWLQILGLMAATLSVVKLARLHMRPIQWHVKDHWSSKEFSQPILVTNQVYQDLLWWTVYDNLSQGMPFQDPVPTVTVTTDASMLGWGGHSCINGQSHLFSDVWSRQEASSQHINLLELRAVRLTLQLLQEPLRGQVVKVECDNTTAVSYLNKQGGTHSRTLYLETAQLFGWMQEYNVQVLAVHRPGVNNELADYLSRTRPDPTEWSLSNRACSNLFRLWGTPQVDLMASPQNHKLPTWYSRHTHPQATATDAFSQRWTGLFVYAFPPLNLVKRTLLQIRNQRVEEAIVVVPFWPAREWFPLLCQMATQPPVRFRVETSLLSQHLQDRGTLYHPDLNHLRLTAWKLNGAIGREQDSVTQSPEQLSPPSRSLHGRSMTRDGDAMSVGVGPGSWNRLAYL